MENYKKLSSGLFISFEGPDCSGKSTQVNLLVNILKRRGFQVLMTREPGGTYVGEKLRHLVKHVSGEDAVCDESELLLFCASRAQLVSKVIQPFLSNGGIVICDRFADSTTAYQGYARGIDFDVINTLHEISTRGCWPDITFLLDLEIREASSRNKNRSIQNEAEDRFEEESNLFHENVRKGYLQLAAENPERIKILNANEDKNILHNVIINHVDNTIRSNSRQV